MKKKKNLYIIMFLCLLTLVGGTLAYFTSTSELDNIFKSGKYKTISEEEFVSPTDWKPGDTTPKSIVTTNAGTIPVRVRIKLDDSWTSKNGGELDSLYFDGEDEFSVADIEFDNLEDWIYFDGYFYYNKILNPEETTSSLIKSVTFNPKTPSDVSCTNDGGVYRCVSSGDGYDDATYNLNITIETVQSDYDWDLGFDFTQSSYFYSYYRYDSAFDESYDDYSNNVFLRITKREDFPVKSDIGFIYKNNTYFLEGYYYTQADINGVDRYLYSGNYYNSNKTLLQEVFDESLCYDIDNGYECYDDVERFKIDIYEDGSILCTDIKQSSSEGDFKCEVNSKDVGSCESSAATMPENPSI